jgi:tetratricopeptide (TPR) repeat protein
MSQVAAAGDDRNRIRSSPKTLWFYLLILCTAVVMFAPICSHPFLSWDDDHTIENNPLLQHPSVANALHYWREPFMDLYVPVTYAVWSALAGISTALVHGKLDPRVFHAASVLLHAINTALVFWLLRRLLDRVSGGADIPVCLEAASAEAYSLPPSGLKTQGVQTRMSAPPAGTNACPTLNCRPSRELGLTRTWPAAIGALLFALHPVQVETIAWTSGMKDLLCATFSLLAVTQYLLAVTPEAGSMRRRVHYVLAMAAMLLGMLSKPTAMVTPLLIVVIDLLVIGRPWRAVLASVWPFFVLAIPCMVWTKLCQPQESRQAYPLWQRPLIAADAIAYYLYKLGLPIRLTYDYGRNPTAVVQNGWLYWTWIIPAAAGAALWYFRKQSLPLIAAALLLVAGIAPVLGLVPFDYQLMSTVTDHYLYLAMLGPALAAAWAVSRVAARVAIPASIIVLGLLALRTAAQEQNWRDSETVFVHAIEINPQSWMSYFKLGYLAHMEGQRLIDVANAKTSRHEDASADRQEATARFADATELYAQAIRLNPNSVISYHNHAVTLMFFGRFNEAADALTQVMRRRMLLPPADRIKYNDDADLLGQCLFNLRRYADAARAFDAARHLDPAPAAAEQHYQRALAAREKLAPPAVTDTR